MQTPEDSYAKFLSFVNEFNMPPRPRRTMMEIIHSVGKNAGLGMNHFIGRIHTWEGTTFITFKERNNPRGKSIYTINLRTLRPTLTSPIQQQLTADLELELSSC
jgi:hypothetical protein